MDTTNTNFTNTQGMGQAPAPRTYAPGPAATGAAHPVSRPPSHTMSSTGAPRDERMIYIGKKEIMSYVLAVVTQFNNNVPEVCLKARGKLISRAVDVAEIVRNRFLPNAKVKHIGIATEELQSMDGRMTKVSSIEITLTK
ncbi:DNA/RNA-binding protein Alba [Candidatus Burarchaeum australiense]|nr:DNA/RNA-binding protein Alba [Candidatus Burarchaeum australiense]